MPAGDPGETAAWRSDGVPTARIVAIDFDFLALLELIGRVVVFARPAPHVDVVGGDVGLVREMGIGGRGGGRDQAAKDCDKGPSHGDASRVKRGLWISMVAGTLRVPSAGCGTRSVPATFTQTRFGRELVTKIGESFKGNWSGFAGGGFGVPPGIYVIL